MNTYRKLTRIAVYLTVLMVMQGCRNEKKTMPVSQQAEELTAVQRLMSKDGEILFPARDELVAARKQLIGELIAIIEEKENRIGKQASVRAAMYVLGEMRAVEAIDVLVEYIGFPRVMGVGEPVVTDVSASMLSHNLKDTREIYPAVDALIKIGEPCLDTVVAKLGSPVSIRACLAVLVGLRGRDFTVETLTAAIEKESDAKKKVRLEASLKVLGKLPD